MNNYPLLHNTLDIIVCHFHRLWFYPYPTSSLYNWEFFIIISISVSNILSHFRFWTSYHPENQLHGHLIGNRDHMCVSYTHREIIQIVHVPDEHMIIVMKINIVKIKNNGHTYVSIQLQNLIIHTIVDEDTRSLSWTQSLTHSLTQSLSHIQFYLNPKSKHPFTQAH